MKPTVGIHENVVLQKVLVSDKGRLMVFLRSKGEGQEKKEENPFEQMNASEVIQESSDPGITFWPFKAPEPKDRKSGQDRTPEQMGKIANGDVQQMKNQFQQRSEERRV